MQTKSTRRLAAILAMFVSLAFAASATAPVASAHPPVFGCDDDFGCGMNHNEVLTTPTSL